MLESEACLLRKLRLLLTAALLCGLVFAAGAMAQTYEIGPDGTWSTPDSSSFQFRSGDRIRFEVTQRAKVVVTLTFGSPNAHGALFQPGVTEPLRYDRILYGTTFSHTSFLEPGVYYTGFLFDDPVGSRGNKMTFSVKIQPVKTINEPVGNHTMESAYPVTTPFKTSGMVSGYSHQDDYYKLTLAKPEKVTVTFTSRDSDVNLRLFRKGNAASFFSLLENYYGGAHDGIFVQIMYDEPVTRKLTFTLPADEICIAVGESRYGGRYDLSLKYAGSGAGAFKMPAKKIVTAGFTDSVLAQIEPSYFDQPGDVVYSIREQDAKYATIDPSTGQIRGLSPGKATLYARSEKLNKTIKCALTVAKNEYTRSKPWYRSARGVYVSIKRLAYSGNNVIADIYIYNRTGRRIRAIYYLGLDLWESDENGEPTGMSELGTDEYDVWRPKGGSLSSGRYAVVRFVFKDQTKDKYNLRLGQLCVDVYGSYSKQAKTATSAMEFVRENMPGALPAQRARPEAAYLADGSW